MVVAATIEVTSHGHLNLTVFLDSDDEDVSERMAQMQLSLEDAFREHLLEFSTVHLRGRKADQFFTKDAFVIFPTRRRVNAK